MPDKKERDLWWHFLSGKPESMWNPAQKSKKKKLRQKQHGQSTQGHMRAWDDQAYEHSENGREHGEHNHDEIRAEQDIIETLNVSTDTGEAENTLKLEPQDFLPTPNGTPAPSEAVEQTTEPGPSSFIIERSIGRDHFTPREPSPQLLKLIDEVIFFLKYTTLFVVLLISSFSANGVAFTYVLCPLD